MSRVASQVLIAALRNRTSEASIDARERQNYSDVSRSHDA